MEAHLLIILLCGAAASSHVDTWRAVHEIFDSGEQASDQQSDDQPPAARPSVYRYTQDGSDRSEGYRALAERLIHALRSASHDADDTRYNDQYQPTRDYVVAATGRQDRTSATRRDRCSCHYENVGYDSYNTKTTVTIMLWAALAVAAWYTPVPTYYDFQRMASDPAWSHVYQQLRKGIERWSGSLSDQKSMRTAKGLNTDMISSSGGYIEGHHVTDLVSGLAGRRRRSLTPWTATGRRSRAGRGGGITQRLQRMGDKIYQSVSSGPGRLMNALKGWSLPSLWSSSSSDDSGAVAWGRGGLGQHGGYQSTHGHHQQKQLHNYYDGCLCKRQFGEGGRLQRLARQFLHNSYWIPLIGLFLLIAEESLWWMSPQTDETVFVNGVIGRTYDYMQSLLLSNQHQ